MIEYRKLIPEEWSKAREFARELGTDITPKVEILFGAYENGELVGIAAVKHITIIEPLVVKQGYYRVSQILGEKAMAIASLMGDTVVILVKNIHKNYLDILEKYGFIVTDRDITVLKRSV
jgi:hypothetical protein